MAGVDGRPGRSLEPDWLDPLIGRIADAADDADALAAIFEALTADHGAEEASRRWWAAFGASDASAT